MSCCDESCGEEEYIRYKRTKRPITKEPKDQEKEEIMYIKNFRTKVKTGLSIGLILILVIIFIYSITLTKIIVVLFGIYVVVNAYIVSLRDDQGVE